MVALKEERDRVLQLVEAGQLTAVEAAQLLDTFNEEQDHWRERGMEYDRNRVVRIRVSNLHARTQKMHMTATIPVNLLKAALRLGAQCMPQLQSNTVEDLVWAIDNAASGRLLDLQDLEKGERLEIFVE